MIFYKKILLLLLGMLYSALQSMSLPNCGVWIALVKKQEALELPHAVTYRSDLISTMLKEFKDQGTQQTPLSIIVHPSISNFTLKKFINFCNCTIKEIPTLHVPQGLREKSKFLSLAYYFGLTGIQRQLEHDIKITFKNLELCQALEQAQQLQDVDLSLPASLMHLLLSKKLTKLFVKAYPAQATEHKDLTANSTKERIDSFEQRVRNFHSTLSKKSSCYWEYKNTTMLSSDDVAVALYRFYDYKPDTLFYFSEDMSLPLEFKHHHAKGIFLYTMNPQASKIISCTNKHVLSSWDKTNATATTKDSWQQTLLDESTDNYFKIFFNKSGTLFVSLHKNVQQLTFKVWDAATNKVIACHTNKLYYNAHNAIDFIQQDQQILHTASTGECLIFDIARNAVIQEWHDKYQGTYYNDYCRLNKSLNELYYTIARPMSLYNHYNQRLVKLNQKSLHFTNRRNSDTMTAEFNSDNEIILREVPIPNPIFFTLDLNALDTILHEVNNLSLSQAVALFSIAKGLRLASQSHKELPEIQLLKTILSSLPESLQDLLKTDPEINRRNLITEPKI